MHTPETGSPNAGLFRNNEQTKWSQTESLLKCGSYSLDSSKLSKFPRFSSSSNRAETVKPGMGKNGLKQNANLYEFETSNVFILRSSSSQAQKQYL